MLTCPYNKDPLTPQFYLVKLRFTGVPLFFLFMLWNLDRGYSLGWGGSYVYQQSTGMQFKSAAKLTTVIGLMAKHANPVCVGLFRKSTWLKNRRRMFLMTWLYNYWTDKYGQIQSPYRKIQVFEQKHIRLTKWIWLKLDPIYSH